MLPQILAACFLLGLAVLPLVAAFMFGRRDKQRQQEGDDRLRQRVTALEEPTRRFLGGDKRLAACAAFILTSIKGAWDAINCHVPFRAESHVDLMETVYAWAKALEKDPRLDTPDGAFTMKLLTGLHLIRTQNHESGMAELTPLWLGEAVPLAMKQCSMRGQACSLRQRGLGYEADQCEKAAQLIPVLVEAGASLDFRITRTDDPR